MIFSNSFRHLISKISKYEPSKGSCSFIPIRITKMEKGSMSSKPKNIKSTQI